jgi:hypothetical protein
MEESNFRDSSNFPCLDRTVSACLFIKFKTNWRIFMNIVLLQAILPFSQFPNISNHNMAATRIYIRKMLY